MTRSTKRSRVWEYDSALAGFGHGVSDELTLLPGIIVRMALYVAAMFCEFALKPRYERASWQKESGFRSTREKRSNEEFQRNAMKLTSNAETSVFRRITAFPSSIS
jgi:hypothetical protein